MKNVMGFLMLAVVSICFTGEPVAVDIENTKFNVHVKVSCDDDTTKAVIESSIKRELRSLGDIELVGEENATWILSLAAIAHRYKSSGNKTGNTSIAIMRLYKHTAQAAITVALFDYQDAFKKDLSLDDFPSRYGKVQEIAKKHGSFPTYNYPDLGLIVNIESNNLSNTCKEIVAEFDVEAIEPSREQHRKLRRMLKESETTDP